MVGRGIDVACRLGAYLAVTRSSWVSVTASLVMMLRRAALGITGQKFRAWMVSVLASLSSERYSRFGLFRCCRKAWPSGSSPNSKLSPSSPKARARLDPGVTGLPVGRTWDVLAHLTGVGPGNWRIFGARYGTEELGPMFSDGRSALTIPITFICRTGRKPGSGALSPTMLCGSLPC
jgi:hypothetical protein